MRTLYLFARISIDIAIRSHGSWTLSRTALAKEPIPFVSSGIIAKALSEVLHQSQHFISPDFDGARAAENLTLVAAFSSLSRPFPRSTQTLNAGGTKTYLEQEIL